MFEEDTRVARVCSEEGVLKSEDSRKMLRDITQKMPKPL